MKYEEFIQKLKDALSIKLKNYYVANQVDSIIDVVYNEIMTECNLAWLYEFIEPECESDSCCTSSNKYDFVPGKSNSIKLPESYKYADLVEIYAVTCVDGTPLDKAIDMVGDRLYTTNINFELMYMCRSDTNLPTIVFIWKCVPDIMNLEDGLYNEILQPMIEGVTYYMQGSIPSQVDGQLDNLSYQRFFNAKKQLKNDHPFNPEPYRFKGIYENVCDELCSLSITKEVK